MPRPSARRRSRNDRSCSKSLLPQQRQLLVVFGGRHCRVGQLPQVEEGRVAAPQEVDQVRCRVQPDTLFLAHGFFL